MFADMGIGYLGIGIIVGMMITAGIAVAGAKAAWRNGVVDGFGYAAEPGHPGYRQAGEHLKSTSVSRWSFLKLDNCFTPAQWPKKPDGNPMTESECFGYEPTINNPIPEKETSVDQPVDASHGGKPPVLWSRGDIAQGFSESGAVTGFSPLPEPEQSV